MPIIYVDADACPVKDETIRVATRHGLRVWLVSNGGIRPHPHPDVDIAIVPHGADAADHWIVDHLVAGDICVTADIPLAAACLEKGGHAIRPNGEPFTTDNIGMALASRSLMQDLREQGQVSGGPRPFSKSDRSAFLNRLEVMVQAANRS